MVKRIQCRHQSHNGRFTFAFAHSDGAQMGPPASFILASETHLRSLKCNFSHLFLVFFCVPGICGSNLLINGTEGESVELPSALGNMTRNDFFTMQWYFNDRNIVKNTGGKDDVNLHSQFRERLQLSSDFSLTITGLILQDSGVYQRSVLRKDRVKIPVHTVHLQLYESVKAVKIQLNTTWLPVKQTCEVHVMCSSSGDQSASYTWRKGNQTVRGRELHFSLSPAEGGVTLTCTVHNGVSEKSTNDTVRCTSAGDLTHRHNDFVQVNIDEPKPCVIKENG
uniref:Immunoglobulin V-set domain-containing protein n=1 Tax=Scleropages formosus TaxID=113540 RepID=A0A8C9SDN2_SCLFO